MNNTATTLAWQEQAFQIIPDIHNAHDIGALATTFFQTQVALASNAYQFESVQSERERVSLDSDYEAAQHWQAGVEMFRGLPDSYTLRCPLRLDVNVTHQGYLVTGRGGFLHGIGDSLEAAIKDYAHALLDYYSMLQDEEEVLAPHLHEHLEQLRELIVEE